jgi:hypothetical protein
VSTQAKAQADTRVHEEDQAGLEAQDSEGGQGPTVVDKTTKRQDKVELKGELEGFVAVKSGGSDKGGVGGRVEGRVRGRDKRGRTGNRNGRRGSAGREEEGRVSKRGEQGGPRKKTKRDCRSNHTVNIQNLPGPTSNGHEVHNPSNKISEGGQLCRSRQRANQDKHRELDIETQCSNKHRSIRLDTSRIEIQSSNRYRNSRLDTSNRQSKIREKGKNQKTTTTN